MYAGARILVTGASGFVGGYLMRALAARMPRANVVGTGLGGVPVAPTTPAALHRYVSLDLLDQAAVRELFATVRPDVVVHLAGQASVASAENGDGGSFALNVGGAVNVACAMTAYAPDATLLAASSAEVYGGSFLASPVGETSPLLPMNAYGRSKVLAEQVFDGALPASTRLILARPFNHTGAGQREDFVLPSFAAQVARIESGLQAPRMAVGNLEVARDFLDVRDVVDAYVALLEAAPRLPRRFVVNIASGQARKLSDLVGTLRSLSKRPFESVVDPARLRRVDMPIAYGEPRLLGAVTGWAPKITIEETLEALLEAARAGLRNHP